LINRNVKMARRMDSLLSIRSMFFAVGAAHLPGDSGVITFLRNRGYQLDPVFSTKKIDPEVYANKLASIPWNTIKDENNLYTIEMPSKAFDCNVFGEAIKMKMCFDLYNMTFFITGDAIGKFKTEKDLRNALDNISEKMGGTKNTITEVRKVAEDGFDGIEALVESISATFKMRILEKNNIIYIIMVGSTKRSNISVTDANHF